MTTLHVSHIKNRGLRRAAILATFLPFWIAAIVLGALDGMLKFCHTLIETARYVWRLP